MNAEQTYHQFTLTSGLRVIAVERPGSKRFAASLVVRAGARDDPPGLDGLAHLVEHLTFAGPNAPLVQDLSRRGLLFNGETGLEKTHFSAVGHVSLFSDYLALLGNALAAVPVQQETFQGEMQIINHEYLARAAADSQAALAMQRVWAPILGTRRKIRPGWKNVKNLRRRSLGEVGPFHSKHYRPGNAVLAVISQYGASELSEHLEQRIKSRADGPESMVPAEAVSPSKIPPLVHFQHMSPQSSIQVVHHFRPIGRYPIAALGLLNDVLGGGPHSSLFRAIRLEHKLAYQVGSQMMNYSECGTLVAHALVPRKVVRPVLGMLLTEFQRLCTQGMPRETFEDARVRLMQRFEMLEEEWSPLAKFLASEYRGEADSPTPQFFLRQLESLDFDAFNKIAREVLAKENRVVVLWGRLNPFAKWRLRRLIRSH